MSHKPWTLHRLGSNLQRPFQRSWDLAARTFQRNPFLLKTVSSSIGFAVGDILMQASLKHPEENINWNRSAQMGAVGFTIAGPLGFAFILWMQNHIMPQSPASRLAITTKITLDQVLGCIVWQAALLALDESYRQSAGDAWNKMKVSLRRECDGVDEGRWGAAKKRA